MQMNTGGSQADGAELALSPPSSLFARKSGALDASRSVDRLARI